MAENKMVLTLEEVAKVQTETNKLLREMSQALEVIAVRATAAEMRQRHAFGQGTDGARFLEHWAIGEDACLSNAVLENAVRRMCEQRSSDEFGYKKIFNQKDVRRAEWFVECFVRTFCEKQDEDFEGDDNVGSRSVFLPSTRKMLLEMHASMRHENRGCTRDVDEEAFEKFFPQVDKARALLTSLMLPINKQYLPSRGHCHGRESEIDSRVLRGGHEDQEDLREYPRDDRGPSQRVLPAPLAGLGKHASVFNFARDDDKS